jgi:hypothetical protein
LRVASVGIQFGLESPLLELAEQRRQGIVERRLATSHTDALDPSREPSQLCKDVIRRKIGKAFRVCDQVVIVAVGTAEIAEGQEDNGRYSAWPVNKGSLQETFDGNRTLM